MPQTLLALMAMMMMTLFAFNQQRNILMMREDVYMRDVDLRATGVAVDQLEAFSAFAFDAATVGDTITTAGALTGLADLGEDGTTDDLDDFDGTTATATRETPFDTLAFSVTTSVAYVEEDDPDVAAASPTKYKKATVQVYALDVAFADTVTLSQLYNCGSRCDW